MTQWVRGARIWACCSVVVIALRVGAALTLREAYVVRTESFLAYPAFIRKRALRVWKTSGSRDGDAGLELAFGLSQLIMQARSFGAIFCGFDTVLNSANAAHRIEDLDDGAALALAGMGELIDEIVLVKGKGLGIVDTTVKVPDPGPAFSLRDNGISDREGGVLPLAAAILQIVG